MQTNYKKEYINYTKISLEYNMKKHGKIVIPVMYCSNKHSNSKNYMVQYSSKYIHINSNSYTSHVSVGQSHHARIQTRIMCTFSRHSSSVSGVVQPLKCGDDCIIYEYVRKVNVLQTVKWYELYALHFCFKTIRKCQRKWRKDPYAHIKHSSMGINITAVVVADQLVRNSQKHNKLL